MGDIAAFNPTADFKAVVEQALPPGFALHHFTETDSTMDEARRRIENGQAGPCVIWADMQTASRGRRGRTWTSITGNLLCSIVEPLQGDLTEAGRRSYLYGVAIARAANALMPTPNAQVKWPNDVLIHRRKVAGVLLETATCSKTNQLYLVTGFGVNVMEAPTGTPYLTTTLQDHGSSATAGDMLAAVLTEYKALNQLWRFEGFSAIRAQWVAHACGIGEQATVTLPNETKMEGTFVDLDDNGAMLLRCSNGIQTVTAGDVFFAPKQAIVAAE